jgi:DNA-binding MltR family transcriptional regulator
MNDIPRSHSETHPHLNGFMGFLADFNKETERGTALAAAAMLDEQLGRIIESFLIPNKGSKALLDGFNAPLGTFSARIASSFALGLLSEIEYRECELIRKVRNEFAHQIKVSFKSEKVVSLCSQLQLSAKSYDKVHVDTRGQFTSAAVALILNLTNRPHYVGQRRLQAGNWKI